MSATLFECHLFLNALSCYMSASIKPNLFSNMV